MTDAYITYQSANAPANERWCAYLTKFKVFTFGSTEEEACTRAKAFYEKQRASAVMQSVDEDEREVKQLTGRGHANTGKVWMFKEGDGFKRVVLTEISMYEANGYVRRGPRSAV